MDEQKIRNTIAYLKKKIAFAEERKSKYKNDENSEIMMSVIDERIDCFSVAIEVLEKQLPKKPKMKSAYKDFNGRLICYKGFCPSCGEAVESYRNESCHHCTQMLDWSE